MKAKRLTVLTAVFTCVALAGTALAATNKGTTATSTITQIKIVSKDASSHRLFHGAIWLDYDKATNNYRWGGAHCGDSGLSDLNVSLLFAAFRSKYSVTIDYKVTKHRDRTYRCITGFAVTR